jgi:ABC-type transport system involved in multi-copper enzyme maturation permease subunit
MNKTLLTKDLRLLLKDLKFQVFFLLLVILFILAAVNNALIYQSLAKEYQADLQSHIEKVSKGEELILIDMTDQDDTINLFDQPSPAVLFSSYDAYNDKISNGVIIYEPTFKKYGTDINRQMISRGVFRLNWYFLISILCGFIMLLMSFEALSGEKRAGTLRLLTVYGFKRQTILWHKYLSYMILYLIIIVPALVSMLLFFALTGTWSAVYMLKFFLILLLSLPFISFFVLLGIFISLSKNYRNSIVIVIFLWLLFVVIIPQFAQILADRFSPIQNRIEYSVMKDTAYEEEMEVWAEKHNDEIYYFHIDFLQKGIMAAAQNAAAEKRSYMVQKEIDDCMQQTKLMRTISNTSPFAQFENISEIIFDKGLYLFNFMQEQTKQTISQIRNLMIEQDSRDENSLHLFFPEAKGVNQMMITVSDDERTVFSLAVFEQPDLLFTSDIKTDDALTKTGKILLRLLPILVLNNIMALVSVIKLERLDIR